jgi:hypothetical protein
MTKKPTEDKSTVLADNARRINDNHKIVVEANRLSEAKAREAIKAVILAGESLNATKKILEHGEWLPWLETNCKGISEPTCQRYMRLAKASHVTDFMALTSLSQAYTMAGIIKRPNAKAAQKQAAALKDDGRDLNPIPRLVKRLLNELDGVMEEENSAYYLDLIEPIVAWYNDILAERAEKALLSETGNDHLKIAA